MPDREYPSKIRVLPIIRTVRTRWRIRMALKGLCIVFGAAFAAFLLSAWGLEAARFSPGSVLTLRILAWAVVAIVTFLFLVRPLFKRVSDQQVALYLEEHEPSLEAAIMGAVEVETTRDSSAQKASPELLDALVERAVTKVRAVDYGHGIDRRGLYQSSGAFAFLVVAALLFLFFGPAELRYGMSAIMLPTTEAAEVSPYSIAVLPGDVSVARGADQLITAELRGFDSDQVFVFSRLDGDESFQRLSMLPADSGRFDLLLLNLVDNTQYFAEANGIRSASYTIEVADLPYVEAMKHTYFFPSYTGLSPREVEFGGSIAALAGTRVELLIQSTIPTSGGRLLVNDSVVMELQPAEDGALSGEILVRAEGVYRIDLAREDGRMVTASPEYTIDLLTDLPPSVAISKPGRDQSASALEEIFIEAKADDDYGVEDLRLVYSVNGEPEETVSLFGASGSPLAEVSAGYTLFLEEHELDPGDVVSYYAVATDNRSGVPKEAMSDIYFIDVRPFRRDFRQAEQQPPGAGGEEQPPGGGEGGEQPRTGSLSDLQRDVVAATFNLTRDREAYSAAEFSENSISVALAQGRVRDEVSTLLTQMNERGISDSDPRFQQIAELLPVAIADMEAADSLLRAEVPKEALSPEQRALTFLQKAEETYERIVGQQQQQQGGGGGGGGEATADELADLFEMELDELQNQYETVQQGERQQASEEADALMEKLKELARRQQQEMERQRARAETQQGGAGGTGGDSQRALAEEAEETARQLEELARKTGDQQLAETARGLQEAAQAMRRSASESGTSQGLSDATSALDDLEEAQRRLERAQEDQIGEGIQDAVERVDRLAQTQEQVRDEVEALPEDRFDRAEEVQQIQDQKDEMVRELGALDADLSRMHQSARGNNPEAAGELSEALDAIREGRMGEKLAYTKGVVEQREREFALEWEDQIGQDIENLRREVEEAAQAFQQGTPDRRMEEALDEAQDLVRGAESLGRRLQNRGAAQESAQGQQGEQGQGEQGQQGEGQQGQQGQGQQGAQGDSAAGQQGQQGQQGQGGQGRGGERAGDSTGQGGGRGGDPTQPQEAGDRRTQANPFGGAMRGNPEPFTEEEIAQYTREFAQRLAQARDLLRTLEASGQEAQDLEEAIDALELLEDPGTYGDLPQIAMLQGRIQENLKRLEFLLRREVEGERPGRAALTGSDEVPDGFRKMVEEYFKNLARRGGGGSS